MNDFYSKECVVCGRVLFLLPSSSATKFCSKCLVNRERLRVRTVKKNMKDKFKEATNDIKSHGCCVCGYDKCHSAIEFHNLYGDKGQIISKTRTLKALWKEIANHPLVILCANCHRELHSGMLDDNDLEAFIIEVH